MYAHEARSVNRVCSGGVQVVLSLELYRRRPHRLMDNSSLRVRVLEFGTRTRLRVYRFQKEPTCRCANWSGDEIAIASPFGLTAGCTSTKHRLYPACFVATTPALHPLAVRVIPPCIRRSIVVRNTVSIPACAPGSYEVIALARSERVVATLVPFVRSIYNPICTIAYSFIPRALRFFM